jgi:hypothetical protein
LAHAWNQPSISTSPFAATVPDIAGSDLAGPA